MRGNLAGQRYAGSRKDGRLRGGGCGGLCADTGKMPGFFVIRPGDVRVICVTIAHYTGWPLRELLALTGEELLAWLDALKRGPLRSRHPERT